MIIIKDMIYANNKKVLQILLALSLVLNLALGFLLYQSKSQNDSTPVSAEEASGIKNFQFYVPCNIVFGYKICTSDFIGLSEKTATYKAKTHGLVPEVNKREGKIIRGYFLEDQEPFRINLTIKNKVVTKATFR